MTSSPFPRGKVSIVGATTFGQGRAPGFQSSDLAAIAARDALAQAGLTPADVDGLFFCHPTDTFGGLSFAQYLGIHPTITDNSRVGGSAFQAYVEQATFLLDAGLIDVALIAFGNNQATATGKLATTIYPMTYEAPYKPINPVSSYALAAARHMHQYGTTQEQLGEVALAARSWAQMNPEAFKRDPLDMETYMASRTVSSPLKVLDCCLVTDGAAAIVLTRTDRARDLIARPVAVLGAASATTHREISWMEDLTVTAAKDSGARAYAAAGVTASDIDVVQVYDAFTINTILFLEDLGFCPKGEGGRFVEGGAIAPGGRLPVNTNGGGLSCCHPGMYGLFTLVEAIRQLRGECGTRQVTDPHLAIAHGNGGVLSSQATVILGSPETI
ncbi:acetyl-CoA acetyltransferase [Novosphingobium cyanobacteriorum]|uniref:Acetyl-CoA acetyltransferase n=1 Tax=Novosphingobium cyanobacteriorum TaxID=3024215 RepID=A0ABT6CKY1_9SPHN|nr:acetyl-CoA acetyltransferase [Novosphingobium cyanobacteriorum]MDF8334585.1 acetyl-CoA acetyltransferase [Novosphingobium cyanobacteriorum]